jgi:hypothetical protein
VGGVDSLAYQSPIPYPDLDYEACAAIQMSYAVTRCDTNQHVWEICKIPRLRKGQDRLKSFQELAAILAAITEANDDLPPLSVGEDFASQFGFIVEAFLGLMQDAQLRQHPFFTHCSFKGLEGIPMFPYKALYYKKKHSVFNSGDGRHCFKSNVDMLRGGIRWIKMFAFWVSLMSGVSGMGQLLSNRHFFVVQFESVALAGHSGILWACVPRLASAPGPARASHSNTFQYDAKYAKYANPFSHINFPSNL